MNQQMLLLKATAYLVVQKDVKSNKKGFTSSSLLHFCACGSDEPQGQHRDRRKHQEGFTQSWKKGHSPCLWNGFNIKEGKL